MTIPQSITDYFEAIRNTDRTAWLATFSDEPGLNQVDPVGAPARTSKEEIVWNCISARAIGGGPESLALTWEGKGTGQNGAYVKFDGVDVIVLDSAGKILSLEACWDAHATLSRLMP